MGVESEPVPLMGKMGGPPFPGAPSARRPFSQSWVFCWQPAGRSSLKGLIKPRVEKQSQALMERGQVRNLVWSLEGHSHSSVAFIECLLYAEPSPGI